MNDEPWLSILIPAFEYPEGIVRILDSITSVEGVECLISDDSESSSVLDSVRKHQLFKENKIKFIRNESNLGAVKNWNKLIGLSQGKYLLLMHHDEFPEKEDFFIKLRKTVSRERAPELIFLRCSHLKLNSRAAVYHMPYLFIKTILKYIPTFLFIFNVVGSPSNVVQKKTNSLMFNEKLKWLVDVEWMVRLLKKSNNWIISKDISLISVYDPSNSITNSIRNQISSLTISEAKKIEETEGNNLILSSLIKGNYQHKFMFYVFTSIRYTLHAFSLVWSLIGIRQVNKI